MKAFRSVAIVTLLGIASIASAQLKGMPDPNAPGGSFNTAVRIIATSDIMIDRFIARWLRSHYPGWDAEPHQFTELGPERYAVVYITHPDNPGRRVYFRLISSQADPDAAGSFPL